MYFGQIGRIQSEPHKSHNIEESRKFTERLSKRLVETKESDSLLSGDDLISHPPDNKHWTRVAENKNNAHSNRSLKERNII